MLSDPPAHFRGLYSICQEAADTFVRDELRKAFLTAENLAEHMQIHKFYKDVTYETLMSKDFEAKVKERISHSALQGALLEEHVAAHSTRDAS